MKLKEYFENARGLGVLATADKSGKVNAAVYARPHVMEDGRIAFIMADRLSHANLQSNPYGAYLFKEEGAGYNGKRLYLKKVEETTDGDMISRLRRKSSYPYGEKSEGEKFLVYFKIEKELPLIGA